MASTEDVMEKAAQVIRFQLSQVVDGVSVAVCVGVSAEVLTGSLLTEAGVFSPDEALGDCRDAIREELQSVTLRALNELSAQLSLGLALKALSLVEAEMHEADPSETIEP